ncbi:Vacuolar protein-sorting-associated protein [Vigna angularis]|uniref:Vacuolar protein-sorting-associated protein n=1 Tax=Phaseolus angularis TaxID=3914 RepID=A0A8T0JTE8_PHAAN|nr:Vacuolar protein-sorting-associated protein [Vigna angularis]
MYQWRKFEFFEEKYGAKCTVPEGDGGDDVIREKKIECCSSGRGKVVTGFDDGVVCFFDRGLKFNYAFQPHSSNVLFLQQLKQRNLLVTIGEDEQLTPQKTALCLKVFDLDKMQPESSSMTSPECVGILRIFTNQFPEAKITSFLVLEEVPPILLIAIGLDNGSIYCIKGDIARERITRFKLQVENNQSDKTLSAVTGLGFKVDGQSLQLFAVTPSSVSLFSLHNQPPRRQTLDQIGCGVNSVAMSERSELIIGRPEAVYFYEVDGRGPCWAFEGEKKLLGWFRGYLLCVIADQRTGKHTFNIYDLKNRLIAHSALVKEVSHLLYEWGNIILIMNDKSALCIGEKDMESKLDMLFKKNLYTVAINLVQTQQADAAATAEVLRKYGDHLYSKQDYDESMAQYILTIGHLEPSYVIQKFLDAQRIYNLTNYLEKLHEKGLASKDHTTLLLNCYTKLKDVEKLNLFIKSDDSIGELKFDVETAIRVCRAANYHEHAMYVAKKAGRHEWYLKILLEDLGSYEEALEYISSLESSQAGMTIKEYGKILIEHKPVETIQILIRLCTEDGDRGRSNGMYMSMLPSPVDFLSIFIHHPQSLMDFLEKYTNKVNDSPAQVEIHNTLLELYISNELNFPSMSQVNDDGNYLNGVSAKTMSAQHKKAIILCEMNAFKDGLLRTDKLLRNIRLASVQEIEHVLLSIDFLIAACCMNSVKPAYVSLKNKTKCFLYHVLCLKKKHIVKVNIAVCLKIPRSAFLGYPQVWFGFVFLVGFQLEVVLSEAMDITFYVGTNFIMPLLVLNETMSIFLCLTLLAMNNMIIKILLYEYKLLYLVRRSLRCYKDQIQLLKRKSRELLLNPTNWKISTRSGVMFSNCLCLEHCLCEVGFRFVCMSTNQGESPRCLDKTILVMEMRCVEEKERREDSMLGRRSRPKGDGWIFIKERFDLGLRWKISSADERSISKSQFCTKRQW